MESGCWESGLLVWPYYQRITPLRQEVKTPFPSISIEGCGNKRNRDSNDTLFHKHMASQRGLLGRNCSVAAPQFPRNLRVIYQ